MDVQLEKSQIKKKNEENQLQKDEVVRQGQVIENLIGEIKELKNKQKI